MSLDQLDEFFCFLEKRYGKILIHRLVILMAVGYFFSRYKLEKFWPICIHPNLQKDLPGVQYERKSDTMSTIKVRQFSSKLNTSVAIRKTIGAFRDTNKENQVLDKDCSQNDLLHELHRTES